MKKPAKKIVIGVAVAAVTVIVVFCRLGGRGEKQQRGDRLDYGKRRWRQ